MKFVLERIARPAAAVAARTAALNHEFRNHALEGEPVVIRPLRWLAGRGVAELLRAFRGPDKVFHCFRRLLLKQPANNLAQRSFKHAVCSGRSAHASSFRAKVTVNESSGG